MNTNTTPTIILAVNSSSNDSEFTHDEISVFDDLPEANAKFDEVIKQDATNSASIAVVIRSTDYSGISGNTLIAARAVLQSAGYDVLEPSAIRLDHGFILPASIKPEERLRRTLITMSIGLAENIFTKDVEYALRPLMNYFNIEPGMLYENKVPGASEAFFKVSSNSEVNEQGLIQLEDITMSLFCMADSALQDVVAMVALRLSAICDMQSEERDSFMVHVRSLDAIEQLTTENCKTIMIAPNAVLPSGYVKEVLEFGTEEWTKRRNEQLAAAQLQVEQSDHPSYQFNDAQKILISSYAKGDFASYFDRPYRDLDDALEYLRSAGLSDGLFTFLLIEYSTQDDCADIETALQRTGTIQNQLVELETALEAN